MADFEGTWAVEEHTFHGNRILQDPPVQITITKSATIPGQYDVQIPLQRGNVGFTEPPNGQTISHTWKSVDGHYGVRLVFDHSVNPAQIVEGPLCSVIERWHPGQQPTDMGTITGTR